MKNYKTKSILACAVLASVLGAAAPVWADEGNGPLNISCTNENGAAYGVVNGLPGGLILAVGESDATGYGDVYWSEQQDSAGEFKHEPLWVISTGVTYRQYLAGDFEAKVIIFDHPNGIKSGYSPVIDQQNLGGTIQGGQYPGYPTQNLFVAGFIGSPQMNFIDAVASDVYKITGIGTVPCGRTDSISSLTSSIFNPDGSTLILDNVGNITVTGKSADSRAVLTMGNGALTYLKFADNDSGITMNIDDDMPVSQFNYYVAEGRDNSLTVLRNLDKVTINGEIVPVNADFWQCLKTADGAQIVVLDKGNSVVAADAAHWGTESHGETVDHFYTPIKNTEKTGVQSMTVLGFDNSNVIALNAETANASATFGVLNGSLRSVNFGTGDACAVSATGGKTATLTDVSSVNVNALDGNANFISVSGGSNITVNGKDNWATVDVKSEKKDANFVFAKDGTNTVNVNGVDAMLYPGADGKAYVAHVKAGETTLNLTDSSVSGNLNTVLVGIPVVSASVSNPISGLSSTTPLQLTQTAIIDVLQAIDALQRERRGAEEARLRDEANGLRRLHADPPLVLVDEAKMKFPGISKSGAYVTPDVVYLERRQLLGPIAVAAYSYMSLVPIINPSEPQPPQPGPIPSQKPVYEQYGVWYERQKSEPSLEKARAVDFIDRFLAEHHRRADELRVDLERREENDAVQVPVCAIYGVSYYTPAYVQAEAGATLNLNMEKSLLMAGVNSFEEHGTVNMNMTNSNWVMQDDSNVNSLQMDDKSEVIFDRDSWKYLTLNVDKYQGQGNIILNADLGYGGVTSDKLVIKKALVQNAIGGSGDPVLNLYVLTDDNPLTDPNTKAEVLTLGEDAQDLQINLITDNIPDNGLWHYAPEWSKDENNNSTLSFGLKRGDELSTVGRAVTGGVIDTQVWYQESDAVFDRVNNPSVSCCATDSPPDVGHETEEQGSVWASYTHSKNTYDNSIKAITSVANQGGIEKRYNGAVVGYDQCIATYPEHNAALYMGGLIGYGEGRNSWSGGNSELDGKGIGIYAGYKTHKGAYLTALAKYNQYNMDVKGYGYNEVKDDYRLHSFGVSVNAGRRYAKDLNKGFYIEPQAELGYVNYGNDNYELKGIKVEMQETKSCRGRLGLQFGTHNGRADVYGRVSYLKDFQGDSDIMTHYLNGTRDSIKVEQGGHWWNFTLGGTFTNGKNLSADVSLNLDRGDHDSKLGFRVGLNWMF